MRYGIAEWYGRSFVNLTGDERRAFAALQDLPKDARQTMPCLPRGGSVACTKAGGVCSMRLYQHIAGTRGTGAAPAHAGRLVTMCPHRFQEGGAMFEWVGQEMLGNPKPLVVGQVRFLRRRGLSVEAGEGSRELEDVGQIDNVLVHPTDQPMTWCALEIQAVYFSGSGMSEEFRAIRDSVGDEVPFPVGKRRPDYRSSGPKRLLPQLEIKVPTLSRWGKKMAVVVDESFFSALGEMTRAPHISNADIAWFVMRYEEDGGESNLRPAFVHLTELHDAVLGLTAGVPVSLDVFVERIRQRLRASRR